MRPARASARLEPRAGAVDVWVADLDTVESRYGDLLSAEERARAERFTHTRDGRRWANARAVLRTLLGEYLQRDPKTVRFAVGAHGKPELARENVKPALPTDAREHEPPTDAAASEQPDSARALFFNLSHAGGLAAYAVARGRSVGVDVETSERRIDVLAVAERAMGPATAKRLGRLEGVTREREFLREWVRHEATLKCLGTGLGGGDTDALGRRPWVVELNLGRWSTTGVVGAVATMGEPGEVRCSEWPA
jgi:4'-phosphopantetheinyl transferase